MNLHPGGFARFRNHVLALVYVGAEMPELQPMRHRMGVTLKVLARERCHGSSVSVSAPSPARCRSILIAALPRGRWTVIIPRARAPTLHALAVCATLLWTATNFLPSGGGGGGKHARCTPQRARPRRSTAVMLDWSATEYTEVPF